MLLLTKELLVLETQNERADEMFNVALCLTHDKVFQLCYDLADLKYVGGLTQISAIR
jgi:hypothetical protein